MDESNFKILQKVKKRKSTSRHKMVSDVLKIVKVRHSIQICLSLFDIQKHWLSSRGKIGKNIFMVCLQLALTSYLCSLGKNIKQMSNFISKCRNILTLLFACTLFTANLQHLQYFSYYFIYLLKTREINYNVELINHISQHY